jgi:hypothetical protein
MRYSNLDDEVFQWVTNFQDPSVRPSITASSNRLYRQRRETGPEKLVIQPPTIEMDQLSRSRAESLTPSLLIDRLTCNSVLSSLPHIREDQRDSESCLSQDDLSTAFSDNHDSDDGNNNNSNNSPPQRSRYLSTISAFPNHLPSSASISHLPPSSTCDPYAWLQYYHNQKLVSVTIVEYTATLLQCAKNAQEKVKFTSRAAYLCYRVTKTVR